MKEIIIQAIFIVLGTWSLLIAVTFASFNYKQLLIFSVNLYRCLPFNSINLLLAIFLSIYILFQLIVVSDLGRSFWHDEVVIAGIVSDASIFDLISMDFASSVGRFIPYLMIAKVFSEFSNLEISYRLVSVFTGFGCLYLIFSIGKKLNCFSVSVLLLMTILINDQFITQSVTFKPYTFGVLAGLIYLRLVISSRFNEPDIKNLLEFVFISSTLSLFSPLAWTGTMAIVATWCIKHNQYCKLSFSRPDIFRKLFNLRSGLLAFLIVSIWCFNLQYILRGLLSKRGEHLYSFVEKEGVLGGSIVDQIKEYALVYKDLFFNYAYIDVGDLSLFIAPDSIRTLAIFLLIVFCIISILRYIKNQAILFSILFFAFSIILSIILDWPFDAERWNIGLIVFAMIPVVISLATLSKDYLRSSALIVLLFSIIQFPMLSHSNGVGYHSSVLWKHRLNPHTNGRETFEMINQRTTKDVSWIIGSGHPTKSFSRYYFNHYDGGVYDKLINSKILLLNHSPLADQIPVDILGEGTLAVTAFHRTKKIGEIKSFLITKGCKVLTDQNSGDILPNGLTYLRASFALMNCQVEN